MRRTTIALIIGIFFPLFIGTDSSFSKDDIMVEINGSCNSFINGNGNNSEINCRLELEEFVPPEVRIFVTPHSVVPNEEFSVTVRAFASEGLDSIWWFGESTDDSNLNRTYWHNCNGEQTCRKTWTLRTHISGPLRLGANARDVRYWTDDSGRAHQASEARGISEAYVEVVERGEAVSGYAGVVMDKSSWQPIPGADISFNPEFGGDSYRVTTDSAGRYRISLPHGRYRVLATHPAYTTYSTDPGFHVVRGASFQTGNIFLAPLD